MTRAICATELTFDVYVFGSNLQGRHGKGAALYCKKYHGAVYGVGEGRTGNSYALPTKRTPWVSLSLDEVKVNVKTFIDYALANPDTSFYVMAIGCGHAGFTVDQIAPLFKDVPENVYLCDEFYWYLNPPEKTETKFTVHINDFMKPKEK